MAQRPHSIDVANLIKAPVGTLSDVDAIDCVAKLIDLSADAHSELGIKRAFGMLREIGRRNLVPAQHAMLHYFRANAWGAKRQMDAKPGPRQWEQPACQAQILALLMARNHEGFGSLDKVRRCQILTNLGIQLNAVGRFIEAIELWDEALSILPNFAIAHGWRGSGLFQYARVSEDRYDREVLLLTAHDAYMSTTAKGVFWDSNYSAAEKESFPAQGRKIAARFDLAAIPRDLDLDGPGLGRMAAAVRGRTGRDAVEALVDAQRLFSQAQPRMYAASQATLSRISLGAFSTIDALATIELDVMKSYGASPRRRAQLAWCMRALVRGAISLEISDRLTTSDDLDQRFDQLIDIIDGAAKLATPPRRRGKPSVA